MPLVLLAYLSLIPQEFGEAREYVAALFWPHTKERKKQRQSLNDALYKLQIVLPKAIGKDRERLYRAQVTTDVAELASALALGDVDTLERLYRGPFLKDVELKVELGGDLGDWIRHQRDALSAASWNLWLRVAHQAFQEGDVTRGNLYCSTAWERTGELPLAPEDFSWLMEMLEAGKHPLRETMRREAAQLDLELPFGSRYRRRRADRATFVGIPAAPLRFSARDTPLQSIYEAVVNGSEPRVALWGMPGVGKTALLLKLIHQPELQLVFPDGVLWGNLGRQGDVRRVLERWAWALGVNLRGCEHDSERAQLLRDHIGYRQLLFVIDDVRSAAEGTLLRCGGPNCTYIYTTRSRRVADAVASLIYPLHPLTADESLALLRSYAPLVCDSNPKACKRLADAAAGLPMTLERLGQELSTITRLSEDIPEILEKLLRPEVRLNLAPQRLEQVEQLTPLETFEESLNGLEDSKHAVYALGAFSPLPERFSLEAAVAVSGASQSALSALVDLGLLELYDNSRLGLPRAVADIARLQTSEAAQERHKQFYLALARSEPS